ncbi:MAG: hypothetical protein IMZ44_26140 [Planctomycetes bacterium]|nr:hypothetical protein [Planctomycetota bacterium]
MPPVVLLFAAAALTFFAASALAVDPPAPAANLKSGISNLKSPTPDPKSEEKVRELFVPFEDLNILLEGKTERVLLSRQQYDELLAKAKKTADSRAPVSALVASAEYAATLGDERAEMTGTLTVSVLEDGLHAVGLDVAGVGLKSATLDGRGAPVGLADDGRLTLFVQGKGQHKLVLEMVAPLQTTAATQVLAFRIPSPPAARLSLVVPGDVEVKSGAPVSERVFDEAAGETRLSLLPPKGDVSLVLSLNSRLKRSDRIIVARSILVDEITQGYERLHATVSMAILHQATDRFRLALPQDFEVTSVESALLARWGVTEDRDAVRAGRRILDVQLREETTDKVVLALSAIRTKRGQEPYDVRLLTPWTFPKLEPLDVAGHVAVVGLLVEDRLKAEDVSPEGLIPIDTAVLAAALPPTVLAAEPGAVRIRPVVAYYAPQMQFGLTARFVKPPAKVLVTTNLLLVLEDGGQQVRGGFAMVPEAEKLFGFDFSVPAGWDVTAVTTDKGEALAFERYGAAGQAGRVHVRLAGGAAAGEERRVFFTAVRAPKDWFKESIGPARERQVDSLKGDWTAATVDFPVFAMAGAARDIGAVAVDARDDLLVRPEALERLTPLDENEKAKYGLAGVPAALAYRYEGQPYQARLAIERTLSRATARTWSFFRVDPGALVAHYELAYDVAEARTRLLKFLLPKDTPEALSVRGLGDLKLKEYTSELVGEKGAEKRRWTVVLADSRKGPVRLAVDFQMRLPAAELFEESVWPARQRPVDSLKDYALPLIVADRVAYQSGLVSVEGSPELQVQVTEAPRKVDVGELADAEYQPGRRLLGAYGFLGEPAPVKVAVSRHPQYALPPAIVQRAELATRIWPDAPAQTAARFLLRTKALFLEIRLPEGSTLWSAVLDGKSIKPQREGDSLLVSLPSGGDAAAGGQAREAVVRDLAFLYETPAVATLGLWSGLEAHAPRLYLHSGQGKAKVEVPLADLRWQVYLPAGYKVIRSEGSVATEEIERPELAATLVAGGLWAAGGGVDFDSGAIGTALGLFSMGSMSLIKEVGSRSDYAKLAAPESTRAAEGWDETAAPAAGAKAGELAPIGMGVNGDAMADRPRSGPARSTGTLRPHGATTFSGGTTIQGPAVVTGLGGGSGSTVVVAGAPTVAPPPAAPAEAPPPPAAEPRPGKPAPAKKPSEKSKAGWALEGFSSLLIEFDRTGPPPMTFQSLGADPRLGLVVVNLHRLDSLAWGLALAVLLVGLVMTARSAGRKTAFVIGVALVATLVPVITTRIELALVTNGMFFAACLLVPYFLAAALVRWMAKKVHRLLWPSAAAAALVLLAAGAVVTAAGAGAAQAAEPAMPPYVIQLAPPPEPVKVPEDAILLPYDPASKTGIRGADRLLIPYDKYVELWNLAYPEKPIGSRPPPAPYALAGAAFTATLQGDEYILFEGTVEIDVYTDGYATIPLPLEGGVLARADLDGKPARLSVMQTGDRTPPPPKAETAKAASRPAPPRAFVVLYASGQGRHKLDLAVRMKLEKRGGWRVAEGRLPAAPATALALRVPEAGTEVRLGGIADRRAYETKAADETIRTALGAAGSISIQWRPKVGEGQIDQTLTAESAADLDVQEDQLRLRWTLTLEFRRGEREFFSVDVPEGYTIEKVEGANVRGWELKPSGARQELTVTLLKRTKERETFTVTLWRAGLRPAGGPALGAGQAAEFDAPLVGVVGAIRHSGRLVIRRSPLLDVRTVSTSGVTRTDLPPEPRAGRPAGGSDESPLGIRPYQAYQFVAVPFTVRLAAEPVKARTSAVVQTILRASEQERKMESRVLITAQGRPLYRARIVVPADLTLDRVQAPGAFEWALTEEGGRKVLTVHLGAGIEGETAILVQGKLGQDKPALAFDLPHLEVLDVERQQGDIVVQADPSLEVKAEALTNVERVLLERVFGWLTGGQRRLAQLALHWSEADYAGRLALAARKPDVSCFTVTNSRITDRAIEDAVLVNWTIKNAGIREVSFVLPAWMKDARISVPLLRQKTVTPASAEPGAPVRVRLALQDEVMGDLKVLVENDRLLTDAVHEAPIPVVETGRTDRRYVAVESAGRDETVVEKSDGLEPLSRQQKEWAAVAGLLRGGQTSAFIVAAGAEKPVLAFRTKERKAVETAKGRIGLAEAVLVMDENGAYRAQQTYHMDNRTEQFLEIQLPPGAALWTAQVAGEPVKPVVLPGRPGDPEAAGAGRVRIPLVKTAAGDLDYAVVLKYGGKFSPPPGALRLALEFPLIRTVNINVDLSQVQLHLPETAEWLYFRGSMRRVTEEGEFEAGILSYQNKMAEGLVQALRFGNPFEKIRAANNLKDLSQSMQQWQGNVSGYAYNKNLQTEAANAQVILQSADKEIQQQARQETADLYGNNDFIRDAYAGQKNVRARAIVGTLGDNWAGVQPPPAKPADSTSLGTVDGRFNREWLATNRLENPALLQEGEKSAAKDQKAPAQQRLDMGGAAGAYYFQGQPQAAQMNQPAAANLAQAEAHRKPPVSQTQESAEQMRQGQQAGQQTLRRGGQEDVVQRYQEKLQKQAEMDQQVQAGATLTVIGLGGGGGREVGGFEGRGEGGRGFFGAGGGAAAAPAAPTGLASLDVELPLRGRLFRFTTPGGEMKIAATAASLRLVEGAERLGAVLALVVLMWIVWRLARRGSFSPAARRTASTVLLVLGVVGVLFGVFPVAGLVALLVGLAMKVWLRFARRGAAPAA